MTDADGEGREEEHCQTATDDGDCLWKYRALILVGKHDHFSDICAYELKDNCLK